MTSTTRRQNIVFILSDDQGAWALGAAGNDEVQTPNLDRLAASGARCENFFCTSPVCSPARASVLTGLIPSRHGVHDWIADRHVGRAGADFLEGSPLVTDLLAEAGYRCDLSGKWHLGANDRPRRGFVHWFAHQTGGAPYYGAPVVRDGMLTTEAGYITDAITSQAIDFLGRLARNPEPFWLSVHYTAPHSPWKDNHPKELVSLYDDCPFTTCPQEPEHPWLLRHRDGYPASRGPDLRAALQGYYAAITAMDEGIGQILDTITDLGLADSTLIVFTSDNGFNCGHHGIWGKGNGTYPQNMYDTSIKVPAIFAQPGRIPAGTVLPHLLSGYDMAPTLLNWSGHPELELAGSPGRTFHSLLQGGPDASARQEQVVVFDEYGPVRMIRTADWKYVRRLRPDGDELYHLRDDPEERVNLVNDAGCQAVLRDLRPQLHDWFEAYAERGKGGTEFDVTGFGQVTPLTDRSGARIFNAIPDHIAPKTSRRPSRYQGPDPDRCGLPSGVALPVDGHSQRIASRHDTKRSSRRGVLQP